MSKLIIHVEDGLVQAVYSTDPETQVIMVDVDNIQEGSLTPIPFMDMVFLQEKSTENCRAEIKAGKFFKVY